MGLSFSNYLHARALDGGKSFWHSTRDLWKEGVLNESLGEGAAI